MSAPAFDDVVPRTAFGPVAGACDVVFVGRPLVGRHPRVRLERGSFVEESFEVIDCGHVAEQYETATGHFE